MSLLVVPRKQQNGRLRCFIVPHCQQQDNSYFFSEKTIRALIANTTTQDVLSREQRSAKFFCKRSESKHFQPCRPYGLCCNDSTLLGQHKLKPQTTHSGEWHGCVLAKPSLWTWQYEFHIIFRGHEIFKKMFSIT